MKRNWLNGDGGSDDNICPLYFFKLKSGLSYKINDDHLYGFRVWKFPFQPEIIFFYFFRCVLLFQRSQLNIKDCLIHVQRCADHFTNIKFHRVWAAVIKTHWKKYFHGHKTRIIFWEMWHTKLNGFTRMSTDRWQQWVNK